MLTHRVAGEIHQGPQRHHHEHFLNSPYKQGFELSLSHPNSWSATLHRTWQGQPPGHHTFLSV